MARLSKHSPLHEMSGAIGRQLVAKRYGDKTVLSAFPDMSKVKPSKLQKLRRQKFAKAVAYAQNINNNPVLKKKYQKKVAPGQSVYHYAISEYGKMHP